MAGLTIDNPVTLRQLAQSKNILPGDTIYLRGGTYAIGTKFELPEAIAGNAGKPVIIRPYMDEPVVMDGSLVLSGEYVRLQNVRITNTSTERNVTSNERPAALHMHGNGQEIINCTIDNAGNAGISVYGGNYNQLIYGCTIYHCGIYEPLEDGAIFERGSAIYNQSYGGVVVKHCTTFRNLETGGKSYGSGVNAHTWDGHIAFENGGRNVLCSNYFKYMTDMVFKSCWYYGEGINDAPMIGGYEFPTGVSHGKITVDNVYCVIARREFLLGWCLQPTLTNSHIISTGIWSLSWVARAASDYEKEDWKPTFANNVYKGLILYDTVATGADGWFDTGSTILEELPTENVVKIDQNEYDAGKCRVAIINWSDADYQDVALDNFLTTGDGYEVHDYNNWLGGAVASGEYSGAVRLRFDLTDYATPIGDLYEHITIGHTSRRFGCFEVRKI